jgi:hypothetical protein
MFIGRTVSVMTMYMLKVFFLSGLSALGISPGFTAQDAGCPNLKSSQIDGRIDEGPTVTCGYGFRIFGLGGGIFGEKCPTFKISYPSHQECAGEANQGTLCAPDGQLAVRREDCECVEHTLLGTGILFPDCECGAAFDFGHIEDSATRPCLTNTSSAGAFTVLGNG